MTNYPVSFFVFKRPKSTYDFLVRMHEAGIKKIYVFADGPRNAEEKILTDQVRSEINRFKKDEPSVSLITNFSSTNLGLRKNIIRGLNAVFMSEYAVIILEDDTQPSSDFFAFTKLMLSRYKDDARIMSINGMSVGGDYAGYSYGFTKYPQCWGWATWKRAWDEYDPTMSDFSDSSWYKVATSQSLSTLLSWYFQNMFKLVKCGQINTWDFQWTYAHLKRGGLAISPSVNLVTNIGFDSAATNTKIKHPGVSNRPPSKLQLPLNHPPKVVENLSISKRIENNFYKNPIAILGLIRQYLFWIWGKYAHRS